jgi:hypothetical protein
MKGDFSRVTFDAANHFSRVLMQQGRVAIDADPNEQAAILLHYVRTLARDLIGPCGGPVDALGFQLSFDPALPSKPTTLKLSAGRYYVDGILAENDDPDAAYDAQPDYPIAKDDDPLLVALRDQDRSKTFWLYLDVWERHITSVEDDRIREVALGGPDTCTRARVVWQVKALDISAITFPATADLCTAPLAALPTIGAAVMAADLDPGQQIKDPCVISPDARFRGAENQLYRVEIHDVSDDGKTATFKWSRDNGSVATAWLNTEGNDLVVANARGFTAGAWVELLDDRNELLGQPGVLVKLASVDGNRLTVSPGGATLTVPSPAFHPRVRRWDQTENDDITLHDGAVPIIEATASAANWIDLEDGVRVRFHAGATDRIQYRTGDYWLIPARVATGDIEWPRTETGAEFLPPRGIEHHFAPLGRVQWKSESLELSSCLCPLQELTPCKRIVPTTTAKPPGKPPAPPAPAPSGAPTPRPQTSPPKSQGPKPK